MCATQRVSFHAGLCVVGDRTHGSIRVVRNLCFSLKVLHYQPNLSFSLCLSFLSLILFDMYMLYSSAKLTESYIIWRSAQLSFDLHLWARLDMIAIDMTNSVICP